jgi:hypothetical protein
MGDLPPDIQQVAHWPFLPALSRLGLAVAIGLFIGLEREHSGKAGVRTFALASLLGAAAGLSGGFYPAVSLAFTALIVAFLNARHLMMRTKLATTTSMALLLVAFCGVLCGEGHVFTPVATGLHCGAAGLEATNLGFCRRSFGSGSPLSDSTGNSDLHYLPRAAIPPG